MHPAGQPVARGTSSRGANEDAALDADITEPTAPRRLGFVSALEGLRAIAVLLVVVSHLPQVMLDDSPDWWPTGGFLGVDLFFVLSGFLITTLIVDEQRTAGRMAVGRFFVRRALRLLPALYALLAFNYAYVLAAGLDTSPTWNSTRDAVLYVANWSIYWHGFDVDTRLGHLWSLSIEEQFYVAWALAMATIVGVRRPRNVALGFTVLLVVLVVVQRARLLGDETPLLHLYSRTDTRADGLLVGALLAQLRGRWPRRPPRSAFLGMTIVASGVLAVVTWVAKPSDLWLYEYGFTAISLLFAIVIWAAVDGPLRNVRALTSRGALLIGRVSYGLYLWHLVLFTIVARHRAGWPVGLRVTTASAVTAIAVAASWFLVERPMLRLKDRWGTRSGGPAAPAEREPDAAPISRR